MAKSARASRVKANRANLRKRVFNPVDDARAERLSEKLMQLAAQPKPDQEEVERMDIDAGMLWPANATAPAPADAGAAKASKKGSKATQANDDTLPGMLIQRMFQRR